MPMLKPSRFPWAGLRCCYLGVVDLNPRLAVAPLPVGLQVGPFKAPDLQILGGDAMDPAMTEHRLAGGDRPWGLWRGRELLCYGWSSTRPTSILTLTTLVPGEREAYLYGFYTPPAQRGRGYYPMLLRQINATLAKEGKQRAWIAVFADNPASWRGVLKAGFRKASTQFSWHGRLSLVQPERDAPVPTLRPRKRGLHLKLGARGGPAAETSTSPRFR